MAASTSSSSSGGGCKHDVFLSFRGEDTRKIFVGHLYRALKQKTLNAFIDSEDLDKGDRILKLLEVIEGSRLSIVVLSENYASSTWCLKEVVKILDCRDNNNQMVVPVFYQVDPSDLRKITGKFADAFAKQEANPNLNKDEVESWRSALIRVAGLSGWDSRDYKDDGELIEEIVESTFQKLMHTSSSKANGLVGMDSHIRQMMSRLSLEVNDARVVGIWGMGGLGKTTIARVVYGEIASQFQHSCFVDNVKEFFTNKHEPKLQEELLSRLLNEKVQTLGLNRGWDMVKERLGTRKVLIVLDDVETNLQIEDLIGNPHAFGGGSRVIVTTRDKQSLTAVNEIYKPMCLSNDVALELFRKNAFKKNQSNEDYYHLSRRAIEYAQGLPLALRILGAFLHGKSVCEWEAVLEKLKKVPHIGVQDVLKTSFDGLDDSEKDIFLDIACHFRGWEIEHVMEILDSCGFIPGVGIKVLRDRALITISEYDEVDMHDLLQDMGREIVRLESTKEPGNRSRVWSYEDASRVLTENTATDAVECLILDLSKSKVDICIHTEAFARMKKLRLLIVYYSFYRIFDYGDDIGDIMAYSGEELCPVDGCTQVLRGELLEFLSHELRLLIWHGCMLKSLPSSFIPKNLFTLDMRGSHLQQLWEGIQPLPNLKVIMLSHCRSLVKIPDLTEAINLQKLYLDGCSSLIDVHSSVLALQDLVYLNLKRCEALKSLSSYIQMKSLETLLLNGCSNFEKFPDISPVMNNLADLDLRGTAIKELPSSINNLTGLCYLNLEGCTELKTISTTIHLSSLQTLNLVGCSNLEKFPEISGVMNELLALELSGTAIKELPSPIDLLKRLRYISMSNCKSFVFLPDSICNLAELTCLNLSGCSELKTLSPNIHMSSLQSLNLEGCSKLEKFPEISGIMKWLPELHLDGTAIKELPSSIDLLPGIKKLSMRNCKSLEFLPDSICNLAKLTHLDLFGCSVLPYLPEKLGDLDSLQVLDIQDSGVKQLPVSILCLDKLVDGRLRCIAIGCKEMTAPLSAWPSSIGGHCSFSVLAHLDLSDCNLLELSDGIAHISSLQTIKLCRNHLESLPATMNRLDRLTNLDLEACRRLKSIPELSSSINCMDAHDCTALEIVSKPKPHYQNSHFFFTFTNCFQLKQTNLFMDILERHSHFQDNCMCSFRLNMPGSAVPDWFNYQSDGSSVSMQLPPNSLDYKVSGIVICAVLKTHHYLMRRSSVTCLCTFKGNHGEQSFSFDLFNSDRLLRSDHMFLGYVSWCLIEQGKLVNISYTKATFQIVVVSTSSITEQLRITGCGVRFAYANLGEITGCGVRFAYANLGEILHLNLPNSQVHVDYAQTGICFLDPYELGNKKKRRVETSREIESSPSYGSLCLFRDSDMKVENESMTQPTIHVEKPFFPGELVIRSETEWKAVSSRSGEGRGMYQTLELLTESHTERKEEEEIMVVEANGEGCLVSGSACCCLSLSGCTMCSRQGGTEEEGDRVSRFSEDGEHSCRVLGLVCLCLSLSECTTSLRKRETEREEDRVVTLFDDEEISELGSHSDLMVPNSESEREEERVEGGFGNGRRVINWKRIATVTVPLLLLAGCGIVLRQRTSGRVKGRKPT